MKSCLRSLAATAVVFLSVNTCLEAQARRPPEPTPAVRAILDALRTYQVVGLGTGEHNNEQGHAFILTLIRHPDFSATSADLVVECGNARYQDVMDRFIAGEDVRDDLVRRSWQDTTQPHEGFSVGLNQSIGGSPRMGKHDRGSAGVGAER